MSTRMQQPNPGEALAETAVRLGWSGVALEEISAALLSLGIGALVDQHGNTEAAEILEELAELLRRRPATMLEDMEPEGCA